MVLGPTVHFPEDLLNQHLSSLHLRHLWRWQFVILPPFPPRKASMRAFPCKEFEGWRPSKFASSRMLCCHVRLLDRSGRRSPISMPSTRISRRVGVRRSGVGASLPPSLPPLALSLSLSFSLSLSLSLSLSRSLARSLSLSPPPCLQS